MTSEFDDFITEDNIEYKPLDIDTIRNNISTYSSQKLCEMIMCDRYFGCYCDITIICMNELSARRANGDDFQFEKVIDECYKQLPELSFKSFNIRDILNQAIGKKK